MSFLSPKVPFCFWSSRTGSLLALAIARWRLLAIAAVHPQTATQFGILGLQTGMLGLQAGKFRLQTGILGLQPFYILLPNSQAV